MSNIFFANDHECDDKIDIDVLYQKNMLREEKKISIFKKILSRIHKRILSTSRTKHDKFINFQLPPYIFGESYYRADDCATYIIEKLSENGFYIKYMHPNMLLVSWDQWIPFYERSEYKKRTGIAINEKGEVIKPKTTGIEKDEIVKETKNYTPITNYKPSGRLVYNPDVFSAISGK